MILVEGKCLIHFATVAQVGGLLESVSSLTPTGWKAPEWWHRMWWACRA